MNTLEEKTLDSPVPAGELFHHTFSAHGLCENPEKVVVPMPKNIRCELQLGCSSEYGWHVGYLIGFHAGEDDLDRPCAHDSDYYPTRQEALLAGLKAAENYFRATTHKQAKKAAGMVDVYRRKIDESAAKEFAGKHTIPVPEPGSIPLAAIQANPNNPRKDFDETYIVELAESIKREGLLQRIGVKLLPVTDSFAAFADTAADGGFMLLYGECRVRACRLLGITHIRAEIYPVDIDPRIERRIISAENLKRRGLNPIEEAQGYADMIRDFSLTQDQVAKDVGKSRPIVANAVRLLDLPAKVQEPVADGRFTVAHGLALLAYKDFPKLCCRIAELALQNGTAAGELEEHIVFEDVLVREKLLIKVPGSYTVPKVLSETGAFIPAYTHLGMYCADETLWKKEAVRLVAEKKEERAKQAKRAAKGEENAAKTKKILRPIEDGAFVSRDEAFLLDLVPDELVVKGQAHDGEKCQLVTDQELWLKIGKAKIEVIGEDRVAKAKPLIEAGWKRATGMKKVDGFAMACMIFRPDLHIGLFAGPIAKRLKLDVAKHEKKVITPGKESWQSPTIKLSELAKVDPLAMAKLCLGLRLHALEESLAGGHKIGDHWLLFVSGVTTIGYLEQSDKGRDEILQRVAAKIAPEDAIKAAADDGRAFKWNDSGVCINAQVIKVPMKKPCHCEIRVAKAKNGKWAFGYDFGIAGSGEGCGGASGGPGAKDAQYSSRAEAVVAGVVEAKQYFEGKSRKEAVDGKFGCVDFLVDFKSAAAVGEDAKS